MSVWSVVAIIVSLMIAALCFGLAMYYKGVVLSMTTMIESAVKVNKGATNNERNQNG